VLVRIPGLNQPHDPIDEQGQEVQRLLYVQKDHTRLPFSMGLISLLIHRFGIVPPSCFTCNLRKNAASDMLL
jgi:hypothetical protein